METLTVERLAKVDDLVGLGHCFCGMLRLSEGEVTDYLSAERGVIKHKLWGQASRGEATVRCPGEWTLFRINSTTVHPRIKCGRLGMRLNGIRIACGPNDQRGSSG